jgi:hypothetical protein
MACQFCTVSIHNQKTKTMKLAITIGLLLCGMALQAQPRKKMRQRAADSTVSVSTNMAPADKAQPTTAPATGRGNRQRRAQASNQTNMQVAQVSQPVANVKLDDLKNPFDTAKTVGKAPVSAEKGKRKKKKDQGDDGGDAQMANTQVTMVASKALVQTGATKELSAAYTKVAQSYKSKNGNVDVAFEKNQKPKDGINTKTTTVSSAMCLTKEEVRGQKIENEIIIADGSKAVQILPGAVIDATVLLNSGEFKFINMTKRKSITLTTTSNLANKVSQTATARNGNDITDELRTKTHALTSPSNIRGMPNMSSASEASISTLHETTGLNIGASFFYMGVKATNQFNFSSEKYRYMYLYTFEQACLPVIANSITSPDDVFTEPTQTNNNWMYVQEVKYGRRLYVMMESEYDLAKYSNQLGGKVSWGVVSAKLSADVKGSSFTKEVNIRVYTQGGQPLAITDESQVQKEIDRYFQTPFKSMDIVPLSFKLTYLDGTLASLVSNAYLDGKNCLEADKARVRLKSIECKKVDDNKGSEEIYGSASINLFNAQNKVLMANGAVAPPLIPTGIIGFGTKDAPINFTQGKIKSYDVNEQGKYLDVVISDLDSKFEILPMVKEKDNGFNSDDQYITENRLKKTLRQMLLEGTTSQTFEFRRKESVLLVTFEITPL